MNEPRTKPLGIQMIDDKLDELGFTCSWQIDHGNKYVEHHMRRPKEHGESILQIMVIRFKEHKGINIFVEAGATTISTEKTIDEIEWWVDKHLSKEDA